MSGLDINGLLVDETQSKLGKEFYEMFFANWNVQEINYEYSLVFQEKPLPSFGAQITVLINDIVVFSQFVQPRYEKLEEMVSIALANAENYMQNYVQIQSELEYDEMKGTGIY